MSVPAELDITFVVGVVGPPASGKGTVLKKLGEIFPQVGINYFVDEAGLIHRRASMGEELPITQFVSENRRKVLRLDSVADFKVQEYLLMAYGVSRWLKERPGEPFNVLGLGGRLVNYFAHALSTEEERNENLFLQGQMEPDSYLGVLTYSPLRTRAKWLARDKGFDPEDEEVVKEEGYLLRQRQMEDQLRLKDKYGIDSWWRLMDKRNFDVFLPTHLMTPENEVNQIMTDLLVRRMLVLAWDERLSDFARDGHHV